MKIKNILSKILGLGLKQKAEPVEPTTNLAQTDESRSNTPQQPIAIPSPGGEGGFYSQTIPSAPLIQQSTHPTIQPPAAAPSPIQQSTNPLIQLEAPARRLTGKVAKLPREIQRIINEMLDDAETYKAIVARLNDLGYPGFFEQNIQRWKDHGYQRWVQFQEKLEIAKREAEEAEELAKDPKNIVNLNLSNQMKQAMDTSRLWDAVSQWDTETTIKNRTFYFQLHRSTTQQAAEQTRRERFNLEAELKRRQQEISEDGKQKIRDLTNPLTQAERKAILDAIDDILGIRIDPDDDGARVSPPAAMQEEIIPPDQSSATNATKLPITIPSPGGEGQGEGGFYLPPSVLVPNNTVEKSAESKAKNEENTVENISPLSVSSVVAPSAPISDSTSVTSAAFVVASGDSPLRTPNSPLTNNTAENSTGSKAENQKNTVENHGGAITNEQLPTTNVLAQPEPKTANVEPPEPCPLSPSIIQSSTNPTIHSSPPPIQQIYRDPFPISPLATTPPSKKQPRNHIPLLDLYGQLIQWVPRDEELTIENVVGFGNRRGQNTCWLNPKLVDPAPALRNVPIVSWDGLILEWVPAEIEPFEKAEPIRSRRYLHYKIGWWEQGREQIPQHYSSAGAAVA